MVKEISHQESKESIELPPRDISQQFLTMSAREFLEFLRQIKTEPALHIEIDWKDVPTARRLKAFLEDFSALERNQKRTAVIRATISQMKEEANVFASGVTWIKVE